MSEIDFFSCGKNKDQSKNEAYFSVLINHPLFVLPQLRYAEMIMLVINLYHGSVDLPLAHLGLGL